MLVSTYPFTLSYLCWSLGQECAAFGSCSLSTVYIFLGISPVHCTWQFIMQSVNETPTLFTLRSHTTNPRRVLMKTNSKQVKCCDLHVHHVKGPMFWYVHRQLKGKLWVLPTNLHLYDHLLRPCFNEFLSLLVDVAWVNKYCIVLYSIVLFIHVVFMGVGSTPLCYWLKSIIYNEIGCLFI